MALTFAKDRQATTYLTPRMLERLDAWAVAHEMQRAEAIRRLLEKGLDDYDAQQKSE
jgi:metal-responsive CopG/Arc/MetJ family transcriptional regulator